MIEWGYIIGALLALVGALIGITIRRIAHFLYPYDFMSVTVYAILLSLAVVMPLIGDISGWFVWRSPVNYEGYGAFISGYVFGYCIDGRRSYIIARKRVISQKHSMAEPWVTYFVGSRVALAVQTNHALWQRLVKKNHIFIICNGRFEADWMETTKYPLFPEFEKPMILFDDYNLVELEPTDEERRMKKPPRRFAMMADKAHGSLVSVDRLCFEEDSVRQANESAMDAQNRYTKLIHFVEVNIPRFFANFLAETYNKSPGLAFMETAKHYSSKYRSAEFDDEEEEEGHDEEETEE